MALHPEKEIAGIPRGTSEHVWFRVFRSNVFARLD